MKYLVVAILSVVLFLGVLFWKRQSIEGVPQISTPSLSPSPQELSPDDLATSSGNFLRNPSFEEGKDPWFSMPSWATHFSVSTKQKHSGQSSALLQLNSTTAATPSATALVYGVTAELQPQRFPKKISGYYFVENWKPSQTTQYLQTVVIVFGAKNMPQIAQPSGNHQIRWILAGASENPFDITNAKFVFVNKDQPILGRWVYFERDLHEDFTREWGSVPEGFSHIRVFFEARLDGKKPEHAPSYATVYFDDLTLE